MTEAYYCEICGAKIAGRPYIAEVDGVEMVLCASCYLKLARSGRARLVRAVEKPTRVKPKREVRRSRLTSIAYEVVEDYAERISEARLRRGLTPREVAERLRISEAVYRKIEQGKFKPSLDLARRIERILGVKIVEPVEEIVEEEASGTLEPPTLGDIVVIRRDED